MNVVNWIATLVGNFLFHLVFAGSLLGGAMGITAIVMHWPRREPEEGSLLLGFGLLCLGAVALGLMGIAKFRDKRVRSLDAETDLAPLRNINPWANAFTGGVIILVCAFGVYWQIARSHSRDSLIEIPVVGLACGVLQTIFGIYQLITGNRKAPPFIDRGNSGGT